MDTDINDFINGIDINQFDDATSLLREIHNKRTSINNNNSKVTFSFGEEFVNIDNDGVIQDEEQLKNVVKRLLKIENELDALNEQAKVRRVAKKTLREQVIEFMANKDVEELNLPDGGYFSLRVNKKKVNPLTKKRLPVCIVNYFMKKEHMTAKKAEEKKEDMMKFFTETAELEEKSTLRRIK